MIFQRIPGLQNINKTWKRIVAGIGYILAILMIVGSFTGITFLDKVIESSRMMVLLLLPYLIIINAFGIREKLPLLKSENKTWYKSIASVFVYGFVCMFVFGIYLSMTEKALSEDQQIKNLAKAQQRLVAERIQKEATEKKKQEEKLQKEVNKIIEEAKNEQELKEKLAKKMSDGKSDDIVNQKVAKLVNETSGDKTSLKNKLAGIFNDTKDDAKKLKDKAMNKIEQVKNGLFDTPNDKKSDYTVVSYENLLRYPKQYADKKIVGKGYVVNARNVGDKMVYTVEDNSGEQTALILKQKDLSMSIIEYDCIVYYGKYLGVSSEVTDYSLLAFGLFVEGNSQNLGRPLPQVNGNYIEVVGHRQPFNPLWMLGLGY